MRSVLFAFCTVATVGLAAGQEAKLARQIADALARRPDDRSLLRAQFRILVSRGAEAEAVEIGRRLQELLPEGLDRSSLKVLVDALDVRLRVNHRQKAFSEATIRRERGETLALLGLLKRLSGIAPAAFLDYARGELHASFGRAFDASRARRSLERFAARSIDGRTLSLLRLYLQEPQVGSEDLRERAVRLAVQLGAREEILPPPVTDPAEWRKRALKAESKKIQARKQIVRYEKNLRRLRAQLSNPATNPRRAGSAFNIKKIERDARKNEEKITATRDQIAALNRESALASKVLERFTELQKQRARVNESARRARNIMIDNLKSIADEKERALAAALKAAQMLEDEAGRRLEEIRAQPLRDDYTRAVLAAQTLLRTYESKTTAAKQAYERFLAERGK